MSKLKIIGFIFVVLLPLVFAATRYLPAQFEAGANVVEAHAAYKISPQAQQLHQSLRIMDWHSDSLLWKRNLLQQSDIGQVDFPRLRQGNVALQMFTAVTKSPRGQNYAENTGDSDNITLLAIAQAWPFATWSSLKQRALYQAQKLHHFTEQSGGGVKLVLTREDLKQGLAEREKNQDLVLSLLGIEGAHALDGDLAGVAQLYQAGYRMIALHHFFDNRLGGSLHGVSKAGLSDFGKKVVQELQANNIIIDVAHSSEAVVEDVLKLSQRPLVVSHTGLKGLCDSDRNISDAHMKKIAAKGGIIAIGYWDGAVCDYSPKGIVNMLQYAIKTLGEDHVALGSDYDGTITSTFDTSELAVLTQHMLDARFTEQQIRKVMGENSIRFLQQNLPVK